MCVQIHWKIQTFIRTQICLQIQMKMETFTQRHTNYFFLCSPCASPHCPESQVEHLQPVELLAALFLRS